MHRYTDNYWKRVHFSVESSRYHIWKQATLTLAKRRERENILCRESKLSGRTPPVKDLHTSHHHSYGDYKSHNGHSCDSKDAFPATALNCHSSGFIGKGVNRIERDYCNNLYNKEQQQQQQHTRDNNSNNLKYLSSGAAGGGHLSSPPSGERNGARSLERRMNTNGRGAMTRSSTPTTTSDSLSWMPPPPPPANRPHPRNLDHHPPPSIVERPNPFVLNPNPGLLPHPLTPPEPPPRVFPPDPFQPPVYTTTGSTPAGVFSPLAVYPAPPTTYPQYPHVHSSLHPHHSGQLQLSTNPLLPPEAGPSYSLMLRQMHQQQRQHPLALQHQHQPSRAGDSPTYYMRQQDRSPPVREETDRRISPHHHHPHHHPHHHVQHSRHSHHLSNQPYTSHHPRFPHPHIVVPGPSSVKTESSSGNISQLGHSSSFIDTSRSSKYGPHYEPGGQHSSSTAISSSSISGEKHYLIKPPVKSSIDEPLTKRKKDILHSSTITPPLHPALQCVTSTSSTSSSVTSAQSLPPPHPLPSQPHYPPHFMKGSIIQLANGVLKRVEDLRTEDFVNSADISADLKIDSSQVVHIEEMTDRGTCILGFSVGEQKIRVTVEATVEHPFFVFGQGWSSCNPEKTQQRYGLSCFKLVVGDICISLTQKQTVSPSAAAAGGSSSITAAVTASSSSSAIGCNGQYQQQASSSSSQQSRPLDSSAGGSGASVRLLGSGDNNNNSGGSLMRQQVQQQQSPGQSDQQQGTLLGSAKSGRISGELSGQLHGSPPPLSSIRGDEGGEKIMLEGEDDDDVDDEGGGSPIITVGDADDESFMLTAEQSRKRRWSAPDQISGTEEGPIDVTDSSSSGTNRTPDNTITRSDQYGTT